MYRYITWPFRAAVATGGDWQRATRPGGYCPGCESGNGGGSGGGDGGSGGGRLGGGEGGGEVL